MVTNDVVVNEYKSLSQRSFVVNNAGDTTATPLVQAVGSGVFLPMNTTVTFNGIDDGTKSGQAHVDTTPYIRLASRRFSNFK